MADQQVALRKRQQIAKSGRVMFFWIAGMAAVIGICAVVSYSLWQRLVFQTNVVNAKNETANILRQNNETVTELRQNIQALSADPNLNRLKVNPEQSSLQVIIDALPADANSLALGSSLQNNLLASVSGISIEALTVTPVGDELSAEAAAGAADAAAAEGGAGNVINFHLIIGADNPDALKQVLVNFEKSIRIIDIDTLSVERGDNQYTMTLDAHAYYQPSIRADLKTEAMTPELFAKRGK